MQVYSIKAQQQPHNPFCSTCSSIGAVYNMETDKLEACGECEMYEDICYKCGDSGEDIWGDECTVCDVNKGEFNKREHLLQMWRIRRGYSERRIFNKVERV